ncbi:unnamed protein product [Miscanthus lutarioriparius]|uniref:Protein kinase domain-containing protein n=1 Tax=Miscanthus lutarioriparius TaxID=422564 RepID=A0A811R3V0_9POAL|nr:unnamed protein product [Miscanthus lutarioriparius]
MAGVPSSLLARLLFLLLLLLVADAARLPLSLAPGDDDAAADALLKLKAGIKDDSGGLGSWSPGTSPCSDGDGGSGPSWKGVMCNRNGVHGLQLEGMGLSGTLDLRALTRLPGPGLRTLSFMDNEFAGPLPDVKELSGLRAVFLSGNKFSGVIPADAFAGMGSLKKVVLSNNDFTGPIPASLADAPRLLELQLNDNKFQGKIPDLKQDELTQVNLANNELEGEIPASLISMPPEMFAGNKKLCGPPLGAKCEAPPSPSPSPSPSPKASPKAPPPASVKEGTTPSLPAADIVGSTGSSSADDAKQDEGQKPAEQGSTSFGVLGAFLGTLAIAGVAFVALRRRRGYKNKNFGPTASSARPSGPPRVEPHPPAAKAEASLAPAPAAAAAGSAARKVEQGRLTFVRDDRGRFFELQDLLKATAEVLGTANLGVCYCATLTTGHSVVVKRFKEMSRVGREDFEEHMRRLGRLSHPNLLPLVAYYYRKEEKLLIHDYVPNRSLANLLHGGGEGRGMKKAAVHWAARLKIVKGVARALSYLYDELCMLTVPHGHFKSSNILLDSHYEPLLTDYALVPVMNQSHAAQLMVAFKSPERKQFGRSSKKSDVWCLGLLILEMLTGKPPTYDLPKPSGESSSSPQKPGPAAGNTTDLVNVVGSTPEGEWLDTVVDPDLRDEEEEDKEEMVKLIRVGMACCETNVDSRWELKTAIDRIEELKAKERPDEEQAFYSTVNDEDYSDVAIN